MAGTYLGDKAALAAADLTSGDYIVVIDASANDVRLVEWDDWESRAHDVVQTVSLVVTGGATLLDGLTVVGDVSVSGAVVAGSLSLTTAAFDSVAPAVSAAGTTQGAATALTSTISQVTSASGGTADGVRLTYEVGQTHAVANESGATVKVYPPSGGSIDDLGANAAYSLADNAHKRFTRVTSTRWLSF